MHHWDPSLAFSFGKANRIVLLTMRLPMKARKEATDVTAIYTVVIQPESQILPLNLENIPNPKP